MFGVAELGTGQMKNGDKTSQRKRGNISQRKELYIRHSSPYPPYQNVCHLNQSQSYHRLSQRA